MKKINLLIFTAVSLFLVASCKTIDLEKNFEVENQKANEVEEIFDEENSYEFIIEEEKKVQDIEPIVVYVERPVYVPEQKKSDSDIQRLTGKDATKNSEKISTKHPEHYKDGTFFYQYSENFVYEIYTQPYHLTDIALEEGEIVQGNILISEDEEVWELTANVAKNPYTGFNIQHLFLKPAYSALDSSMVVITDRRVYHFRIKSYSDTHMAMVKFTYPQTKNIWATSPDANGLTVESEYVTVTNPELLSFDYKMKYGIKKPEFLPTQVYDDGLKTYIVLDEIVLFKKLPVLFNERNEIVNYSVHKNTFIVPRLINKVTLRLGKEKVVIEKKNAKSSE